MTIFCFPWDLKGFGFFIGSLVAEIKGNAHFSYIFFNVKVLLITSTFICYVTLLVLDKCYFPPKSNPQNRNSFTYAIHPCLGHLT